MLPIPRHLKDIMVTTGDENSENLVNGIIRCPCGCECFMIKTYAEVESGYPQICEYKGDHALMIKSKCADCAKEFLIFDNSKHGWNGFVCHDGVTVPDNELKSWNCPKCTGDNHKLEISIMSQGKQDFVEETGIADGESEFSENDWIEAFEWITIGLTCFGCGYGIKKWIDYETM